MEAEWSNHYIIKHTVVYCEYKILPIPITIPIHKPFTPLQIERTGLNYKGKFILSFIEYSLINPLWL